MLVAAAPIVAARCTLWRHGVWGDNSVAHGSMRKAQAKRAREGGRDGTNDPLITFSPRCLRWSVPLFGLFIRGVVERAREAESDQDPVQNSNDHRSLPVSLIPSSEIGYPTF